MVPLRVSITKFEWLPDDPTAFVPSMLWKLPFITTWDDSQNQSHPTDSAEEAEILNTQKKVFTRLSSFRNTEVSTLTVPTALHTRNAASSRSQLLELAYLKRCPDHFLLDALA